MIYRRTVLYTRKFRHFPNNTHRFAILFSGSHWTHMGSNRTACAQMVTNTLHESLAI